MVFESRIIWFLVMNLGNMIKHFLHDDERKHFNMAPHSLTNDLSLMVKGF